MVLVSGMGHLFQVVAYQSECCGGYLSSDLDMTAQQNIDYYDQMLTQDDSSSEGQLDKTIDHERIDAEQKDALECNDKERGSISKLDGMVGAAEAAYDKDHVCHFFDKFVQAGVPQEELKQAMKFYEKNASKFTKNKKISIADYSVNSKSKRFFTE